MIDSQLNKILKPTLTAIAKQFIKLGVKANHVTFIGFFFGICCLYLIIKSLFINAIIFLFLNRFCEGLDGAISLIQ